MSRQSNAELVAIWMGIITRIRNKGDCVVEFTDGSSITIERKKGIEVAYHPSDDVMIYMSEENRVLRIPSAQIRLMVQFGWRD